MELTYSRTHAFHGYLWPVRRVPGITDATARELTGPVDPARALAAQNAYLNAFFDRHLHGRDNPILHHPTPAHPDVVFPG